MNLRQVPVPLTKSIWSEPVCSKCLSRFLRSNVIQLRRPFGASTKLNGALSDKCAPRKTFRRDYFSAYSSLDRRLLQDIALDSKVTGRNVTARHPGRSDTTHFESQSQSGDSIDDGSLNGNLEKELPHRRRKRLKEQAALQEDRPLPLDASSQLTTAASSLPAHARLRRTFATYLSLSKPRLSFLIVLTTTSAYSLYPIPEILSSATSLPQPTLSTSTLTLLYLTTGTFLSCASANTLNMLFEPQHDAKMSRTRNRPLVRKLLSSRAALLFAIFTGSAGLTALYFGTNPTVAFLSGLNIFLYAGVYTPMKRISALNTWVGAVVGGIPPLMGWAAAAGQTATTAHDDWKHLLFSDDGSSIGGWLLAALLFAWQFPHFNALSHGIREEYKLAGHKMLCWTNPARNGRVALRYTVALFPICIGLWYVGVVNSGFVVGSTILNGWMLREAYRFWKYQGAKGSARGLFWASIWQLPLVLVGGLVFKEGVWKGVWERGQTGDEEFEDETLDGEEGVFEDTSASAQQARPTV